MFLFPFFLSGLLVNGAAGESEVIAYKTICVSIGEDVILPCNLTLLFDMQTLRVEWTHDGKDVHVYRKGGHDQGEQHEDFKNRTSLFRGELSRGNISLKLTNVTERDKGKYICNVKAKNFPEHFNACSITLEAVLNTSDNLFGNPGGDAGISTGAIVGIFFAVVVGISVGIILLVNYRKIRMCAGRGGRQQNEYNAARMNEHQVRNDDAPD